MPEIFGVEYKEEPWGCWVKPSHKDGTFNRPFYYSNGKTDGLHREIWRRSNNQEIPSGLYVRHKCDYPPCFNPSHLEIGTREDNEQDKLRDPICDAPKPARQIGKKVPKQPARPTPAAQADAFVGRFRRQRGARGLRQIGAETGIHFATLSRIERTGHMDLGTFLILCAWLQCSPNEALGWKDAPANAD